MMHRFPYMSDPSIVPRVQKYLEANINKHFIDINTMADDLQKMHKEYSKRKRSVFRSAVKKAYAIVMKNYSLPMGGHQSSDEDVTDDSGEEVQYENPRFAHGVFGSNIPKVSSLQDELIDISSDEEEASQSKNTNGPPQKNIHHLLQSPEISLVTNNENSNPPSDRGKKRKLETPAGNLVATIKKKKLTPIVAQKSKINFTHVAGIPSILMKIAKLMMHIKNPDIWKRHGRDSPRGILLHGPPGCGKTFLVDAIAGQYDIPLWKVSAPELIGGISGESEERVRELFQNATASAPSIIFIDDIDVIAQNRQYASKDMEKRIVVQLLNCMDNLAKTDESQQVVVIGATNRPDSIDPGLRRPGRFDREICLGIPDAAARLEILKLLASTCKLDDDVNLELIARNIPGYVGADIAELIGEAIISSTSRLINELKEVKKLERAVFLRTQAEKKKKQQEKTSEEAVTIDADPDPEIILDGDSKDKTDIKENSEDHRKNNDSPVLVIDDDIKQTNEKPEPQPSCSNEEPKEENDEMQVSVTSEDPLEEINTFISIVLTKNQIDTCVLTMEDFQDAIKDVQPFAKREGFATVPDVSWEDVGSLESIREELQMDILAPVRYPDISTSLGLGCAGILLCGPPGCGKTLLAKAIANEAGINFISVNGPELFNMYVGESERAVRVCFERARNSAPCVIFFDEIDALCQKRSDSGDNTSSSRVVNQLLTEMDGIKARKNVFLLAASNRPDIIDPAILRPGRIDKIIYVGLPTPADRVEILRALTKNGQKPLLAPDVDLEVIGKSTECQGYTGADLASLVKEAGREAFRDLIKNGNTDKACVVTNDHFTRAAIKVKPSVSEKDQKTYEKLKKMYSIKKEQDVEEMEFS